MDSSTILSRESVSHSAMMDRFLTNLPSNASTSATNLRVRSGSTESARMSALTVTSGTEKAAGASVLKTKTTSKERVVSPSATRKTVLCG